MKKMISALLTAVLVCVCALPAAAEEGGYYNFKKIAEYAPGAFSDVAEDIWYRDSVAAVYELGLMQGADGLFRPEDSVTLGEAAALASRLHSLYHTGKADFPETSPWYTAYVDYAVKNGVIGVDPMDWEAPATRAQFAHILSRALPEEALPAVNDVADDQLPDVRLAHPLAAGIYRLYRAGVLTGNNRYGAFAPERTIERSSAATIVSRMAYRSLRQKYTLDILSYPDLAERDAAPEGFFSNSAMLGNSLAQGMQLYSGLDKEGMSFFCYQSITVNNADDYVTQLCQRQYDRVYIEYGINEIYMQPETFAAAYGKIVDRVRAAMPEAEIYVMAVTPVTAARSSEGTFTMTKIRAFNTALHDMAEERECWYLDCCETLCDDTGYLVGSYAGWDGSPHLDVSGYRAWADVIRTHYA